MHYTITEVFPDKPLHPVELIIQMDVRDWHELEKSEQWAGLESFLDNVQKQRNHSQPLMTE